MSPVAPAVSKSLHSARPRWAAFDQSGCPRSLQVATFLGIDITSLTLVRLPPQSPSRYIRCQCAALSVPRPVAPAVSKSLHSRSPTGAAPCSSGCPRSLQVATFAIGTWHPPSRVRLPPQSPSRYIHAGGFPPAEPGPVAPAVSKSLHSRSPTGAARCLSGCPRSLQVATFLQGLAGRVVVVRLPPQSPSRYILPVSARASSRGPVAPAVSKSLHSPPPRWRGSFSSGCPRSLQVATFRQPHLWLHVVVRLPPQSPSRYIPVCGRGVPVYRPVAPAVSKSLHSSSRGGRQCRGSGCPRSLQVATFFVAWG